MKTHQANLINSLTLILMPLWAYLTYEGTVEKPEQSITALIPLFLGVILLLCNKGVKHNNKIIAHIAVLITLIAIGGLLSKPLMSAIEEGRTLGIFRVSLMVLTSVIAMITFIKSFIQARKK
tara:strand:- start:52 stop:417 length:366 start_codon:yes stop_codon:yes gene_type:complete